MKTRNLLSAVSIATVVAISASSAYAVPQVGNPLNGPATLNTNPGPGNFDVVIGSHDGSQGAQFGNGTWSTLGSACGSVTVGSCGPNQEIETLNSNWVGNNGTANGTQPASSFTTNGFWLSFAQTGAQGTGPAPGEAGFDETTYNQPVNLVPNQGGSGEDGSYTYTFAFTTGNSMANMGLWVYADDTAEVFISGNGISEDGSNGTTDGVNDGRLQISLDEADDTDDHCGPGADEGIGCQFGEQAFIEVFYLEPNSEYTIEIETLQLAERTFGLMFAGGLQNVPEPGALAVLGLGVLGLGIARRRRKAAV